MQYEYRFRASKTVLRYVPNDREVLVFVQQSVVSMSNHDEDTACKPLVDKLREQVRMTFSPHLNVIAYDAETNGEVDEFTDYVIIHVQTNDTATEH